MARRQAIDVPGLKRHQNPIPHAARVGNMICTSVVGGHEFETEALPDDPASQIRNAFANLRRVIEAGGGSTGDIVVVEVLLADMAHRGLVNEAWLAMFPDADDRPARHTSRAALSAGVLVHLKAVAVVS